MDVCEPALEAVVVVGEAFVVEAHEVKNGRVEVVDAGSLQLPYQATGQAAMTSHRAKSSSPGLKALRRTGEDHLSSHSLKY